jgi:hypothetical protein
MEYKFSVKHFPIWCYKCDTMFFVDKTKQISFIYHTNCITYSIFSNAQQLFYIAKSSGHLN